MMRTNREMTLYEVHEESVSCITEPYEVIVWGIIPHTTLTRYSGSLAPTTSYPANGNFPLAGMNLTKVRPN